MWDQNWRKNHYSYYMKKSNKMLNDCELTIEEFEKAFKKLEKKRSLCFDDINPNMVISSYNELLSPLFHICKLSLATGCFLEKLKIAKITPLFKSGGNKSYKKTIVQFQYYLFFLNY